MSGPRDRNDLDRIPEAIRRDVLREYLSFASLDEIAHRLTFHATYRASHIEISDGERARLLSLALPLLRLQVAEAEKSVEVWRKPVNGADDPWLADAEKRLEAQRGRLAEAEAALATLSGAEVDVAAAVDEAAGHARPQPSRP